MASEALLAPNSVVSMVSSSGVPAVDAGRVRTRHFIMNEARGVVGEYGIVGVCACDGVNVGVVVGAGAGTWFDACDSGSHSGGGCLVYDSAHAVGLVVDVCLFGVMCTLVSCPGDRRSK